jgi:hypothetical protein
MRTPTLSRPGHLLNSGKLQQSPSSWLTTPHHPLSSRILGKPFYIQVAPIGCHDACYVDEDFNGYVTPPVPAPRHAKLYAEVNLPHDPSFNEEDVSDKPAWVQALPRCGCQLGAIHAWKPFVHRSTVAYTPRHHM